MLVGHEPAPYGARSASEVIAVERSDHFQLVGASARDQRGFTVRANRLEELLYGWRLAEYSWPTVVVETLRPFGGPGLLFDVSGCLARCAVWFQRERLLQALDRAGLEVVEVCRWGWEAPEHVPRARLGAHANEVLASIISD